MTNIPAPDTVSVPSTAINPETVLCSTTWCVVREQRDEYLVYNSHTDELHLISPTGRYLYLLCDGLRTVAEIQALLPPAAGATVPGFLEELVTRGLVEPGPPPDAGQGAP